MVQFTKEIMMLFGASLAVMWFPLWFCLFNMHLSVQCTSCRWPEGIQSEKSSLAIMCCLLYQRVQFRYKSWCLYKVWFTDEACYEMLETFTSLPLCHICFMPWIASGICHRIWHLKTRQKRGLWHYTHKDSKGNRFHHFIILRYLFCFKHCTWTCTGNYWLVLIGWYIYIF